MLSEISKSKYGRWLKLRTVGDDRRMEGIFYSSIEIKRTKVYEWWQSKCVFQSGITQSAFGSPITNITEVCAVLVDKKSKNALGQKCLLINWPLFKTAHQLISSVFVKYALQINRSVTFIFEINIKSWQLSHNY